MGSRNHTGFSHSAFQTGSRGPTEPKMLSTSGAPKPSLRQRCGCGGLCVGALGAGRGKGRETTENLAEQVTARTHWLSHTRTPRGNCVEPASEVSLLEGQKLPWGPHAPNFRAVQCSLSHPASTGGRSSGRHCPLRARSSGGAQRRARGPCRGTLTGLTENQKSRCGPNDTLRCEDQTKPHLLSGPWEPLTRAVVSSPCSTSLPETPSWGRRGDPGPSLGLLLLWAHKVRV